MSSSQLDVCMHVFERDTHKETKRQKQRQRDLNQAFTYRDDKFCRAGTQKEVREMTSQVHLIYENMLVSWSVGQNNNQQVNGMQASSY